MAKHLSNQSKNARRRWYAVLGIFAVIALLAVIFLLVNHLKDKYPAPPEPPAQSEELSPKEESDSIAIPGYEGLNLAADTKKQNLALNNPESNTCYFVITLSLEDGTLLWQSDYIAPGEAQPLKLLKKLETGNYKAVLNYSCFRMNNELTPLNGAEMKLTLRVK